MMSFSFSGGVEVYGFISPTDITDQYPVIDPLYGIDGFRNVNTLSDLNSIPNLRRRAGMVVGVSGGTTYYKLNPSPWNGTISDWSLFQTGGGSGVFTGGTVTGDTIFTTNLSATTFSATTYLNLPIDPDTYITGFTYNDNTFTINDNSGNTFNATISTVTGITINGDLIVTGDTIVDSFSATTLNVNGVNITGDTYVTGGTYYTGGTIIFDYNTIGNFPVSGLTEDLNTAIAGLAETDELTIELEIATNKIRLKDVVAPGSGNTRTFQGDIVIESGITATTAFIIYTQWTLDFMDSLDLEIYAPNDISIDSIINLVNSPTTTILVNNLPYTPTTLITSGDKINVTTDINSVIQFNITNYL
jgi:hypothetical protein